jgi:hypothetical protein
MFNNTDKSNDINKEMLLLNIMAAVWSLPPGRKIKRGCPKSVV